MLTAGSVYTQTRGYQMKIIQKEMPLDFNLFLFGDDHEGSILRYDAGWTQLVKIMNGRYEGLTSSHNFGIDHGDVIEAITVDDKRYDGLITKQGQILQEISMAKKHRETIKKKLLLIMEGNHPEKLWRFGRITEDVCQALGVDYGTWDAIVQYTHNGKLLFNHFCSHGYGTINSTLPDTHDRATSMKRSLRKKFQRKTANCLLNTMGHTHKLIVCPPESELLLTPGKKNKLKQSHSAAIGTEDFIPFNDRWYVNTGSFYRTYGEGISGYAERAGYDPVELGCAVALVRKGRLKTVKEIYFD